MLNRRGFLSILSAVSATAVLDPERLLWVPGAKCISIPTREEVSAAVFESAINFPMLSLHAKTHRWFHSPKKPLECQQVADEFQNIMDVALPEWKLYRFTSPEVSGVRSQIQFLST